MFMPVDEYLIAQAVANARQEDRREFECLRGLTVEQELRHSLGISEKAQAFVMGGRVVAIFGEIKHDDRVGVPWLISTTEIAKYRRAFLVACDREVAQMRKRHQVLINYTDARYAKALRWLRWLGFEMHDAIPYGASGELFHPMTLRGF
ncbi:hypothetical protein [Pseudomonas sp. NUPR-001]|uniref:hypothetical protein n=1 Tax=Pseudomonas sp. NUPR-001 TaxID=3416058 RepID=UPI003F9A071E